VSASSPPASPCSVPSCTPLPPPTSCKKSAVRYPTPDSSEEAKTRAGIEPGNLPPVTQKRNLSPRREGSLVVRIRGCRSHSTSSRTLWGQFRRRAVGVRRGRRARGVVFTWRIRLFGRWTRFKKDGLIWVSGVGTAYNSDCHEYAPFVVWI